MVSGAPDKPHLQLPFQLVDHLAGGQLGARLQRALENLRKQHKWRDISDEEYRTERSVLVRQLKLLDDAVKPHQLPNLERAAEFLQDLPSLWLHAGVTHEEREALVKQVFQRITIDGKDFVDIEPKPEYAPLFATMVTAQKVGYQELDSTPTPDTLLLLPSGITVSGVESWIRKLADVA